MKLKICLSLIAIFVCVTGCSNQQTKETDKHQAITKVHTSNSGSQSISEALKNEISKREDITSVKAVNTDKEILVAVKMDQYDRFHIKKSVKEIKSELKKTYPKYKIDVTADSKIFLELGKLETKMGKDKLDRKAIKKELKNLKKLMKEKA